MIGFNFWPFNKKKEYGFITRVQDENGDWITIHDTLTNESNKNGLVDRLIIKKDEDDIFDDKYEISDDSSDNLNKINPATGLPGDGFMDVGGNVWYTNSATDHLNDDSVNCLQVNPATGLPGDGVIDVAGNVWYTDSESHYFNDDLSESLSSCDDLFKDINDDF